MTSQVRHSERGSAITDCLGLFKECTLTTTYLHQSACRLMGCWSSWWCLQESSKCLNFSRKIKSTKAFKIGNSPRKLGTNAIFVGTTIVVRRERYGRRMTRSHHSMSADRSQCDARQQLQITQRYSTFCNENHIFSPKRCCLPSKIK